MTVRQTGGEHAGAAPDESGRGLWHYDPGKPPEHMNPVALAYLGDAVFELLVRQYLLSRANHRLHELHRQATSYVSAKAQAELLRRWQPLLTEEEADLVRRGRNAKSGGPTKNADPAAYRLATGLECLVGYLYYHKRSERLHELLELAFAGEQPEKEDER
ncbi:ribonuclease III [Paenibacillus sp. IB182496]|uniref:Mini-ribonuclease 3 n=1 Tax=Paenibacillus sabuli TaxID=2772509 RepID=A0A927BSI6_9BACL|nr:ribonuclease III domain-containing protein [Paenibacillus sabuli]MBD2844744.1 ribonuclease III [Paenibacillus sabuli]